MLPLSGCSGTDIAVFLWLELFNALLGLLMNLAYYSCVQGAFISAGIDVFCINYGA